MQNWPSKKLSTFTKKINPTYNQFDHQDTHFKLVIVEVRINLISSPGRPFLSRLTTKSSSVFSKVLILVFKVVPESVGLISKSLRPSDDRMASLILFLDMLNLFHCQKYFFYIKMMKCSGIFQVWRSFKSSCLVNMNPIELLDRIKVNLHMWIL